RKETATGSPGAALPQTCTGRSRWITIWLERILGKVTCADTTRDGNKRITGMIDIRTEASHFLKIDRSRTQPVRLFFRKRTLTEWVCVSHQTIRRRDFQTQLVP